MEVKRDIATEHGIDLSNYEVRNITITQKNFSNIFLFLFLFLIGATFLIFSFFNEKSIIFFFIFSILGLTLCFLSIYFLIYILYFKIEYRDNVIHYRSLFKNTICNCSELSYFKIERILHENYYRIKIYLSDNRTIHFEISQTNKAALLFLLNLLKNGVPQN